MKNKAFFIALLFLPVLTGMRAPEQAASFHFALRIYPQGQYLVTCAIVTVQNNKVVKEEIIARDQFVMMMGGLYRSKPNPASEDVFKKNNIFTCKPMVDTMTRKLQGINCPLLDEVWKIRYKKDIRKKNYFYSQNGPTEGWAATDFFPSKAQFLYLRQTYGADGCNEFIWGDNLFKFMHDVQDTAWVNKYKAMN